MMKMQSTSTLRYLASGVDGGQDDVVVPVGCLHAGPLQRGSVRVVEEARFPVQLLGRSPMGPPPTQGPNAYASPHSSFSAVDQQPAGGGGTVVGWERRHGRGRFTRTNIWNASAGWGRGGVIV